MSDLSRKILLLVLGWLLPAHGQRRATSSTPCTTLRATPHHLAPSVPPLPTFRRPAEVPLRGEDSCLVRPYLLTDEEWRLRRERRAPHARRRELWFATHGLDSGPRWIHGVEVPTP
ncbi:hypothetical protein [Streptomyces chattanoogensis]|uniref:hypothetical protein n=1 Tax=Streptomyces chattanoogensis TaxID=66876 RepID=UPI0036C44C7F